MSKKETHLKSLEQVSHLHLDSLIKRVSVEFAKAIQEEATASELSKILNEVAEETSTTFKLDAFRNIGIPIYWIWDLALKRCGYDPNSFDSDSENDLEIYYSSIDFAFDCEFNIDKLNQI